MMDAFQRYFDYEMRVICGIPRVTLTGTIDDWRSIRDRIDQLCGYDIDIWIDHLRPIAENLLATAEGRPSLTFWRDIYIPKKMYGGELSSAGSPISSPTCATLSATPPPSRTRSCGFPG